MTAAQKIVLVVAAGLVIVQCLMPPWYGENRGGRWALDYAPVFSPETGAAGVDFGRLLPALIATIAGGVVGYIVCKSNRKS